MKKQETVSFGRFASSICTALGRHGVFKAEVASGYSMHQRIEKGFAHPRNNRKDCVREGHLWEGSGMLVGSGLGYRVPTGPIGVRVQDGAGESPPVSAGAALPRMGGSPGTDDEGPQGRVGVPPRDRVMRSFIRPPGEPLAGLRLATLRSRGVADWQRWKRT